MKQVFFTGQEYIVEEVPAPMCLSGGVLVQNHYSVISPGTETNTLQTNLQDHSTVYGRVRQALDLTDKAWNKINREGWLATWNAIIHRYPALNSLGYSSSGNVIQVGEGVSEFKVGDRVACAGSGYANHADIIWVPKNLVVPVANNISLKNTAYIALGAIAMQGIRRSEKTFGERILIIGLGLLGQLGVQIARSAGLHVTGFDINPERALKAKEFGAGETFTDHRDLEKAIPRLTEGQGFDSVIIFAATSSDEPVNLAMKFSRKRGRVVVVGSVGMGIQRELMYSKELDLVMATSYGPGRYDPNYEEEGRDYPIGYVRWTERRNMEEFIRLIQEGEIDTEKLTDLEVDLEQAPGAYKQLLHADRRPLGVILSYKQTDVIPKRILETRRVKKQSTKIRTGVVGAGGFALATHIPNIMRDSSFELRGILNTSGAKAKSIASKCGAAYAATDLNELITRDDIDALIICTPHYLHTDQSIAALNAGKHVLVEKPLAISMDQLDSMAKAMDNIQSVFTVGFNRRYSPLVQSLRDGIAENQSPVMIQYRINAGFIPPDHWIQKPEVGGGRIIGEVCHFVDTCSFLIQSPISKIKASGVPIGRGIMTRDNITITLEYENGSIANIFYAALGDSSLPKEKIEVFVGQKAAVLDNFVSLAWHGSRQKNLVLKNPNKGWKEELEEFAKAIKGLPHRLVPISSIIETTQATFEIEDQIKNNT